MENISLVGLRSNDVVKRLAEDGAFAITSYNRPIALVIEPPRTKRDLYAMMEMLARELFDE